MITRGVTLARPVHVAAWSSTIEQASALQWAKRVDELAKQQLDSERRCVHRHVALVPSVQLTTRLGLLPDWESATCWANGLGLRRLFVAKREGERLENESAQLDGVLEARRRTLQEQVALLAGPDQ